MTPKRIAHLREFKGDWLPIGAWNEMLDEIERLQALAAEILDDLAGEWPEFGSPGEELANYRRRLGLHAESDA